MIVYNDGIHLRETDLWFDSKKKVPLSFISNAKFNNFAAHKKIIATPQTIKLLGKKVKKSLVLPCPFFRPFSLGKVQVELIPSGYILGSSQVAVDFDGRSMLYTGDLKIRPSETTEQAVARHCDVLVMKCRYGLPNYIFPHTQEVMEALTNFIDNTLAEGNVPVLLVDPLGKAQDLVKILGDQRYSLSINDSIYKVIKIYEEFGVKFSNYQKFSPTQIEGKVLFFPPYSRDSDLLEKIENKRIGVVMGWALERLSVKSVFRADEAFPLSDHCGYDELIQFVEIVRPEEVYLVGGFSIEFARTLQKRGFDAKPLEKPTQLKLL